MKLVRKNHAAALKLPTLKLEGGLFLPDVLEKAALGTARLQLDADYGLPKGIKPKDEYSRAFQIACAQWKHFAPCLDRSDLDPLVATTAFVTELLRDAMGYSALAPSTGVTVGDRHYAVTRMAGATTTHPLPIVIAPHMLGLDEPDTQFAIHHSDGCSSGTRKKSAFQLAQELLNASPEHQWALVSNGKTLRLLRDVATLTRPSFLEVDLQDLLAAQRFAEFAMVWRLLHASRAGLLNTNDGGAASPNPHVNAWEAWLEAGQIERTRVREGLRQGVTQALLTLGQGFLQHSANDSLRRDLQDGTLSPDAYFQQLLRLIYRFIFLFSVEERGLLHITPRTEEDPQAHQSNIAARRAYAEGYAQARLQGMALRRRARNRFDDL